jgi:hypothetical protein
MVDICSKLSIQIDKFISADARKIKWPLGQPLSLESNHVLFLQPGDK